MKEIKFRAWDVEYCKMIYFTDIFTFGAPINHKDFYIYMQFIGRKDKNDKDIYASDIYLDINNNKYLVKWDNHKSCFYGQDVNNDLIIMFPIDNNNITIIGNLHENMELIT